MARVKTMLRAAAVALLAAGVTAQTTTDFSGRWTLVPDAPAGAGGGPSTLQPFDVLRVVPSQVEGREPQGRPEQGRGATGSGQSGGRGGRGAPGTMGSGWGADITVTQDATTLTVEYQPYVPYDMQPPMKFVYLLNGSESKNTINKGRGPQEQISRAVWDGSNLVITTVHSFKNPQSGESTSSETRQVLSLASPTSLVVETTRNGVLGGRASTTKTMYKK